MSNTHRWKVIATGDRVQKQFERDMRRRRLFKIVKVNGELAPGEKKRRVRTATKKQLRELSPEVRDRLLDLLAPTVSRLEKADDPGVRRSYSGRPVLIGDGRGGERRVGDHGVQSVEKGKRVSMEDIATQAASYPDGTRRR